VDSNSREAAQLRSIWNLFCNEYLYSIDEMDIYTYAYIGALDADYVTNEAVEENNFGVLVRRDRVGFSDYEDAKLLSLYNYAETSGNGWDSDGELYTSPMEVEFDLSNQLTTIYALVRAKDSDAKYGATDKVTIYGYNVESEQYEEIFTDGEIMEFEDGCPYLDVNGKIRLQFTCPDTSVWTYTPQITVVGGEF
jgi:hypothetical protein